MLSLQKSSLVLGLMLFLGCSHQPDQETANQSNKSESQGESLLAESLMDKKSPQKSPPKKETEEDKLIALKQALEEERAKNFLQQKALEEEKAKREALAKEAAEARRKQEEDRLAALAKAEEERLAREAKAKEAARLAKIEAEKQAANKLADKKTKEAAAEKARLAKARSKAQLDAEKRKVQRPTTQLKLAKRNQVKLNSPTYTPLGGERSGNLEGTIPPWTGTLKHNPNYRSGQTHPNLYADEQPMFTIHGGNAAEYKDYLSEGQLKLLEKYADTFYMHVYPSHREGRYNTTFEKRTLFNKEHTQLNNGIDNLKNYTGGIPFPFPQNGAEAMWNSRFAHPQQSIVGVLDDVAIYLNGNQQLRRQKYRLELPFANPNTPVGVVDEKIGVNAVLVHISVEKPERIKGQMTIVHEALDQVTNGRKSWVYVPGSRRVRRAPSVGFDTPDGPGGLVTVDDSLGFNGAMERYEWSLVDKKEIYIPYHSYAFDDPEVDYDTLLQTAHANPDYMRYELHRVWVVEATLKKGANHIYAKRRFYIDEDSWQIVLLESYDGRGDLWRVGILNTIYDYAVQGYIARAQVFHDLQSGSYIALRLFNETEPSNFTASSKGEKYFSPANLRKMGTR